MDKKSTVSLYLVFDKTEQKILHFSNSYKRAHIEADIAEQRGHSVERVVWETDELAPTAPDGQFSVSLYDEEEKYDNCTVQIWKNSVTGDCSIGWWKNEGDKVL